MILKKIKKMIGSTVDALSEAWEYGQVVARVENERVRDELLKKTIGKHREKKTDGQCIAFGRGGERAAVEAELKRVIDATVYALMEIREFGRVFNRLEEKERERSKYEPEPWNGHILEEIMEIHGAIPGDWRHFFDDLRVAIEKEQSKETTETVVDLDGRR